MAVAGCASISTLEATKMSSRKFKSVTNIPKHPSVRTRLVLLLIGVLILGLLSLTITGTFVPADNDQALVFQGGFLLVVFGSLFLEDKFTKPADAVINSIAAIISLIPVYASNQNIIWYLIMTPLKKGNPALNLLK